MMTKSPKSSALTASTSSPRNPHKEPNPYLLDALRARTVPPDLKTKLDKPITSEEVVTAIQRLAHGKTPGPDGLPAEFYQEFHPELAPLLHAVFLEATQTGHFPADITQGDISFHFKKGDPREACNYRPISLLQVDYKIFSHILVRRIKLTLDHIISCEQLGFVPKRLIGEATLLLKLIQAYLADENEEGLILTLDWEKAFDRCSWSYYHAALSALDFGPHFISLATFLSDPAHPPRRQVKTNGRYSSPFSVNCGFPQGCRFFPLAFLIVAEALTRFIITSPSYEGIQIGGVTHRISHFADDTQLLLKDFGSLRYVWALLQLYELATGMRANIAKLIAILCGALRGRAPPIFPPPATLIRWLKHREYTKILGIPFWSTGENDVFWHELHTKVKKRVASWGHHTHLTIHGRVHLANLVVMGIPRYWTQTLLPPEWFDDALLQIIKKLLWDRTIDTDTSRVGAVTDSRPRIIAETLSARRTHKPSYPGFLGLGLVDWSAHTAALRIQWLLAYINASDAPWKLVLDQWFARTYLRRGAAFSTLAVDHLVAHISAPSESHIPSNLPKFWVQALIELRNLKLTPLKPTRDGALANQSGTTPTSRPTALQPIFNTSWSTFTPTPSTTSSPTLPLTPGNNSSPTFAPTQSLCLITATHPFPNQLCRRHHICHQNSRLSLKRTEALGSPSRPNQSPPHLP
jgi:hypothetical protein